MKGSNEDTPLLQARRDEAAVMTTGRSRNVAIVAVVAGLCVAGVATAAHFSTPTGTSFFSSSFLGEAKTRGEDIICSPKDLYLGGKPSSTNDLASMGEGGGVGNGNHKAITSDQTVNHEGHKSVGPEDHPETRLAPHPHGKQPNVTFILHVGCIPEELKARNADFWREENMPIKRAYIVRHNFGSTSFFDFKDAEENLRMTRNYGDGTWEAGLKFTLTTDKVDFEYGYAVKNSRGKVLYEIGGSDSPFYGQHCVDAQMYGSYWNRVMTINPDPSLPHTREEVFATCDEACLPPPSPPPPASPPPPNPPPASPNPPPPNPPPPASPNPPPPNPPPPASPSPPPPPSPPPASPSPPPPPTPPSPSPPPNSPSPPPAPPSPPAPNAPLRAAGNRKCIATKFNTEFRSGGAWRRYQNMYIKTPLGGRTPHEYTRNSRKVRAVIITEKGFAGKPTMQRADTTGWPVPVISQSGWDKWYHWTSNDACSANTQAGHYGHGNYFKSPGNWNVYVSRFTAPATWGVKYETYGTQSTWGGKNITVGVVDEFWNGISDNGCSAEMPISDNDFLWRLSQASEGSGSNIGSYTTTFSDDFGTTASRTANAAGSSEHYMRLAAVPVDTWCSHMANKVLA